MCNPWIPLSTFEVGIRISQRKCDGILLVVFVRNGRTGGKYILHVWGFLILAIYAILISPRLVSYQIVRLGTPVFLNYSTRRPPEAPTSNAHRRMPPTRWGSKPPLLALLSLSTDSSRLGANKRTFFVGCTTVEVHGSRIQKHYYGSMRWPPVEILSIQSPVVKLVQFYV